jgi:hypothetical protein
MERGLESSYKANITSAEAWYAAEKSVANYGIEQWTDRFLDNLHQHRQEHSTGQRPVFFICHSTGGIIVKDAMRRKPFEGQDITAVCLGVTFFSTPHHGSSVLSKPEYAQTVQVNLGLKWEMSETLRRDFSLRNAGLESLNYDFALRVAGVKIYSFVERYDTGLTVLATNTTETIVKLCIVDSRSGKLSSSELPIEDEQINEMGTTHVGAPRFVGENLAYSDYIDDITYFVKSFSAEERLAYHALNNAIMTGTKVDVHQFYAAEDQTEPDAMNILSASPSLKTFLELGPSRCMEARIQGEYEISPPIDHDTGQPATETQAAMGLVQCPVAHQLAMGSVQPPINPKYSTTPMHLRMPKLIVTDADNEGPPSSTPKAGDVTTPLTSTVASANDSHTKGSSTGADLSDPESPGRLRKPANTISNKLDTPALQITDADQGARPKYLFTLPNPSSDRFKWIHVPFTLAGMVPHVLTTISQERGNMSLHSKLLTEKMWFAEHNNARHAAPHARFVRPGVKCLLPKDMEHAHVDHIMTPLSATNDVQFVVYLPYLHWDSFRNLQRRARIIQKRREQPHARPVDKDVAIGKSMEHKLIWQHLSSAWPVHCRRTLDQYGYPTLRSTEVRDGDQILYKRTILQPDLDTPPAREQMRRHKRSPRRPLSSKQPIVSCEDEIPAMGSAILPMIDDSAAKVLMVDQLWLWIMDKQTVITFFASKEKEEMDKGLRGEGNLRSEIYRDVNGDYANQCKDPFDFAALAVSHAVKAMLDRTIDRDLQVFGVFEEYISILTERQTSSFKQFRNRQWFEGAKDINDQQHIDNRRDLDALLELRDIEDELNTIRKLIKEQQECVAEMLTRYHGLHRNHGMTDLGVNGIRFLVEVDQFLADNEKRIDGMKENAHAAQSSFKDLLDMKQKQASIVEAHLQRDQTYLTHTQTEAAVEQSRVATEQSRVILIFTVITIIFLPLSFFASVFGINSREWSGNGSYPSLRKIFTYMTTISLAVIAVALSVAFYKRLRILSIKLWTLVGLPTKLRFQGLGLFRSHADEDGLASLLDEERAMAPNGFPIFPRVPRAYTARLSLADDIWLRQPSVGVNKLA